MLNSDPFNSLVLVLNSRVHHLIPCLSDLHSILLAYEYDELPGLDNLSDMSRELYETSLSAMSSYVLRGMPHGLHFYSI